MALLETHDEIKKLCVRISAKREFNKINDSKSHEAKDPKQLKLPVLM